mmetsp:Transcript_10845/g.21580  ORF Transcript_10845/g.21580 Transcript_10845/m.21580 type:complete len:100 (+) Transcript_10845:228-527(+)
MLRGHHQRIKGGARQRSGAIPDGMGGRASSGTQLSENDAACGGNESCDPSISKRRFQEAYSLDAFVHPISTGLPPHFGNAWVLVHGQTPAMMHVLLISR